MFGMFAKHAAASAVSMFNTGPGHGEAIGCYRGQPLYHASLDRPEYEALLEQSGFEVLAHTREDEDALRCTVRWVARRKPCRCAACGGD